MIDAPMSGHRARSAAWPLGVGLLAALAVLVYLPGLHGGFAFDDFPNILQNTTFQTLLDWRDWVTAAMSSPARDLPRPLSMLSFALNVKFGGLDDMPFKAVNIAIHAANAVLACLLALRLFDADAKSGGFPRAAALLAAGMWALHPVNATAVLLVVQRMESLSHLFVFAGLLAYCRIRTRQSERAGGWFALYAATIGFTAGGILAKESAALLPLYALCLETCLFRFRSKDGGRKLLVFFLLCLLLPALIGIAWLLPKSLAPGAFGSREFTLWERLLTEPRVLIEYVRWFFIPDLRHLSFYHDDFPISRGLLAPWTTLISIVTLTAMAVGAVLVRRRVPLVALGVLWFLSAHALTATFVPLELVFEHRNYFASFGLSLAVVAASAQALRWFAPDSGVARRAFAFGLAAVLSLAFLTNLRAREWSDPLVFAVTEAAKQPQSPRATYYLGWMLSNATGYRADSPYIDAAFDALDRARAVDGSGILADHAALILAARTGRPLRAEWWRHMQSRLRDHAIGAQEISALGNLTTCQIGGQCAFPPDEMMATFAAALSRGPQPTLLGIYANYVLNEAHDPDLALRLWQEAQSLDPNEREHTIAIAKMLMREGRFGDAEREIARLRRMGHLGQHGRAADDLEVRLARERAAHSGR